MAAGYIQVTYVTGLLCVYAMVMQLLFAQCFQLLAAPCPGLIPLVECSVVLVPYIVLSCYVAVVVSLLNMHLLRVRAHMSLLWCFKD